MAQWRRSRVVAPDPPAAGLGLLAALYVGGLLGPFGGGLVNTMLPELRDEFGADSRQVGFSLTAYFVPFAVALLVSGTLGERWGRTRTVRTAYFGYAGASLLCALAPTLGVFLAGRALQGAANAFTTPLLLAGLVELSHPDRAGRAVGIYASFQAAGQSLSPILGGVATEVNWRLAFVALTGVALLLASSPPPGEPRPGAARPPWRALLQLRVALLGAAALGASLGCLGVAFLVALRLRDDFGLGAAATGAVLVCFGVAGLLCGTLWGRVIDRVGGRTAGSTAAVLCAVLLVGVGRATTVTQLVVLWTAMGFTASLLTVAIQSLATGVVPANRGGGVSVILAFRFGGLAIAPALWLPLAEGPGDAWAFGGAAVVTLTVVALLAPLGRWVPGPTPGWGGPAPRLAAS